MQIFYMMSLTWSDSNKRWYSVTWRLVGNSARPSMFWTSSRGRKHFNWPTSVWAKLWTIWKLWESLSATRAARIHNASIICTAVWQRRQLVNEFINANLLFCKPLFYKKYIKNVPWATANPFGSRAARANQIENAGAPSFCSETSWQTVEVAAVAHACTQNTSKYEILHVWHWYLLLTYCLPHQTCDSSILLEYIYIYILKLLHRMLSSLQTLPQPVFSWVWSLEDSGLISKLREAWCCKGYACKTGREKDTSEELHQIHNQSQSYFLYFNDAGMYLSFDLKNPEKRTLTSLPNFNCIVRSVGHPTVGVAKGHNFESLGTTGAYKSFMFLRIHFFIL